MFRATSSASILLRFSVQDFVRRTLDQELARLRAAQRKASPAERMALQTPKRRAKERRATLRQEINSLKRGPGSDSDRVETLAVLRNEVATPEQGQIVQRLVQRVDYDAIKSVAMRGFCLTRQTEQSK